MTVTLFDEAAALALIERTHLALGKHKKPEDGMCAMELVSFVAGEPFSDHPECVCPVIGAFVRSWNDGLPDDERDAILKPILPRLIGTRGNAALAQRRSLMSADWLVRTQTPAWLRLAKLDTQADALASLPEIISTAQIQEISGQIDAAKKAAAAGGAAGVVAWAAGDAARAAAGDAAWAAGAGAWAAWAAAWAAGDAARAAGVAAWAAGDALNETRLMLQRSAAELVVRMIEAKVP